MSEELCPLSTMFELRYKEAWKIWRQGDNKAAEVMARELLQEPRFGRFHKAGMHMLLSTASHYYLENALEAVRLFTEISMRNDLTDSEREGIAKSLNSANKLLDRARLDRTRIDHEIQKILDNGMTMDELHDAQIKEMHQRLNAEEEASGVVDEDTGSRSQSIPDSQDVPGKTDESQRTDFQNSTHTMDFDDNDPLPDIVRYNFDNDQRKIRRAALETNSAKLDVLEVLEQLLKQRARLLRSVFDIGHDLFLSIHTTRDRSDGHKSCGRTSCEDLAELLELLVLDRPLLDLPPVATPQLLDAIAGDTVNDSVGVGHSKRDIIAVDLGADEAARAELVNFLVPHTIQVQRDTVALVTRLVAPAQHRSVVPADLGMSCAMRRRAIKILENEGLYRMRAVVDTRGDDKDGKDVLLRRRESKLCAGAVELRTDVQRGACLVGRHEACIQGDGGADGVEEEVLWDVGHGDDFRGVLQTLCVTVGAEDGDAFVVGGAEGLQTLIQPPNIEQLLTFADLEAHVGPVNGINRRRRKRSHDLNSSE
ncbi:hypothetical protein HG530_014365 [Fusarium avenaceum]|nr:hypothetical protein HG530_014365 [Fusarium avenaceum]